MKNKLRNLFLLVSFFGLMGFISYQILTSDNVKVREILIEGAEGDHKTRILKRVSIRLGDPFWKINLDQETSNIRKDQWVEAVELRRALPSTLIINVTLKKPVALVGDKKGGFIFIDDKSNAIDTAKVEKAPDLPMMLGENILNDKALREKSLSLFAELPKLGTLSREDVSHLEFESQKGFFMTLQRTGMQVQLGHQDFSVRLDRARRVVQYLEKNNIDAKRVDADFTKKVMVQTKDVVTE